MIIALSQIFSTELALAGGYRRDQAGGAAHDDGRRSDGSSAGAPLMVAKRAKQVL